MVNVGKYTSPMDPMGETNSSHLRHQDWKISCNFWGPASCQVRTVSFGECFSAIKLNNIEILKSTRWRVTKSSTGLISFEALKLLKLLR